MCSPCPAGYACQDNIVLECALGTYSLSGDADCMECPAGYQCPHVHLEPQVCNLSLSLFVTDLCVNF